MKKKHEHKPAHQPPQQPDAGSLRQPPVDWLEGEPQAPAEGPGAPGAPEAAAPAGPGGEALEQLFGQVADLEKQVIEWKDRALRAAADLDNYRRRAMKERDEALTRGQGEVLNRIIEVVDDLARVAHLEPARTSSEALHEGMLAIERKFQKMLETAGVEKLDPAGAAFDPTAHEAVTVMPAPSPAADGTVGVVLQPGYRLRGTLLRPARVAVLKWTAPAPADVVH